MTGSSAKTALIVGAGAGLSAALARRLAGRGIAVTLAARSTDDLAGLAGEIGARVIGCDATRRSEVDRVLSGFEIAPDILIYNASYRTRGAFVDLDPAEAEKSVAVTALGGFHVAQAAAWRMLQRGSGTILFTGASASVKGYAQSAPFAMGKFALRGLAQSMARELSPLGIHVAHVVIDGGIRSARRPEPPGRPDSLLDPDDIAATYLYLIDQPRSAWSWEIEIRPWVEKF